ncbi:hypothetical protein LTR99_011073 [Exophiala xenobiotica]|uniref:Uncharacterized protein n=1 Tax=Vermiconidia calcicola TaxID=1690605 RepID=A0AAV9PUU8_9PEZI|nr:hypothetical protein LTR99_011073 [Exophiala xenobiotica]KAK5425466.1 hypothetical protein LTR34_011074 [Exophiala xenobiotica]KAK5527595.1 hypothetical protein LTR25_011044 [Vermiconidia calcicola]KAK5529043.1 hypothetical protein LTR23_010843 [Chaetothyriales sp. CCFEE 6169]
MASNDGHSSFQIDVRLRLCHQLEPIKSQNSESQPYLDLASLSILKLNSTPRPTGIFAPATDHYKVLKVETRSLFARLTSNNSSFSNLNEIGLFTNVNLNKSYPGMRVVLFRASYSQTIGEPDGARRVILPDKTKIFNPRLHSHQQSYRTWAADEKNSAKPDPWQTTTLPGSRETYTQAFRMFTGGYYHALFCRENGYAGIISDIQYMCVILFPESQILQLIHVNDDEPGPVVGHVNGKPLKCQWPEDDSGNQHNQHFEDIENMGPGQSLVALGVGSARIFY